MNKEKIEGYEKLVENKTFTTELLIACVRKNEPYINKYAYLKKQFQYAGDACNGGNIYEFNRHMGIRNNICKALKHKYTQNEVKELVKQKSQDISAKLLYSVVALLDANDYTLLD